MKHFLCLTLALALLTPHTASARKKPQQVTVAVMAINDFHGAFARDDYKGIPGGAALWQTVDSLKRVYPHHLVVTAGDNFGGSYFYYATQGRLMAPLFRGLGIDLSAVGNHEFDEGQDKLARRWADGPEGFAPGSFTYVCANVRGADGAIPPYLRPYAARSIDVGRGRQVKVGFVGLLTGSTPQQVSKSRIKGLTFDARYTAVLDSVKRLPDYATTIGDADVRLLLTHIGTAMQDGKAVWDDMAADNLAGLTANNWHGILTSHTHQAVEGRINSTAIPVVQGLCQGRYVSIVKATIDLRSHRVLKVETELCRTRTDLPLTGGAARFAALTDSLLAHTRTAGGTPLGERLTTAAAPLTHSRTDHMKQTALGTLVCRAYAEALRRHLALPDTLPIVGVSHFGSIRGGLADGPVRVLDVGEALPFSNELRIFRMKGADLQRLVEAGLANTAYGRIQTSWLDITADAKQHVTAMTYQGPTGQSRRLKAEDEVLVVADDFMTHGGDGYAPALFPDTLEMKVEGLPATTDAFINYLKTLPTI